MTAACIAFAAGVLALQLQPELPGTGWIGLFAFLLLFLIRKKIFYLPAAFAVGFCWALGMAHQKIADRLGPARRGGGEQSGGDGNWGAGGAGAR